MRYFSLLCCCSTRIISKPKITTPLLANIGSTSLPIITTIPETQRYFYQAIALLLTFDITKPFAPSTRSPNSTPIASWSSWAEERRCRETLASAQRLEQIALSKRHRITFYMERTTVADFVVDDLVSPADVVRIGPCLVVDDHAQHPVVGAQIHHQLRSDDVGIGQDGNAVLGRTSRHDRVVGEVSRSRKVPSAGLSVPTGVDRALGSRIVSTGGGREWIGLHDGGIGRVGFKSAHGLCIRREAL